MIVMLRKDGGVGCLVVLNCWKTCCFPRSSNERTIRADVQSHIKIHLSPKFKIILARKKVINLPCRE